MRSEAEIRAHKERVLDSWAEQGQKGGLANESEWLLKGWLDAFAWVLNDPTPINTGDSESKPEASGG